MIRRKNMIKIIAFSLVVVLITVVLIRTSIIDISQIKMAQDDFQYNLISMSAIIGGFLFTGLSILISAIDKERIERLWKNNYLDNLYRSAFGGMISNVITIIAAFLLLCKDYSENVKNYIIYVEIVFLVLGLAFFLWCIKFLLSIISKLKDS